MTQNKLYIFLLLLPLQWMFAQQATTDINLSKLNTNLIQELFLKKLNALRLEQNARTLSPDKTLEAAAKDQANYMNEIKEVTHSQKAKDKQGPWERVKFYHGTHALVGENCAKIFLKKRVINKKTNTVSVANTYEEAANSLFLSWFNSPGHYKNMIAKQYDVQGLSLVLAKDSSLYATQVFSAKPFLPPKDKSLPDTDHGILVSNPGVCNCMASSSGTAAIESLSYITIGDSLFLKSEDLKSVKKFFTDPKDAIYLDIVLRKQFTCDNNNLLHGSEIYEGSMLKPAYFPDLFKNNRAKDGKNLFSPLCRIPGYFHKENYQANIGYVKKGYACLYEYVSPVPHNNLDILYLFPKYIYDKDLEVIPDTFKGSLKLLVPFDRNSTTVHSKHKNTLIQKLQIYEPYLKRIQIKTYSSVEGNAGSNLKLQEARAIEISKIISSVITKTIETHLESKENWETFYLQIKKTPFAYLSRHSTNDIKQRLQKKSLVDSMDYILAIDRIAEIEIEIEAIINNESSAELVLGSYKKASRLKDSLKAFRSQNRLMDAVFKKTITRQEVLQIKLPYHKKFLPIWANYLALAATDPEAVYSYSARDTALKAIAIDSTYIPLQFNFCILALRYLQVYADTLIPIARLELKMKNAFKMAKDQNDSVLVNHMWLNYSLLSLYRHWELHQYDKLDKHLSAVKKYYPLADISTDDALRIGLLFNMYHRYSWTTELLLPFIKLYPDNEDLVFLFIQTYNHEQKKLSDAELVKYLKRAKRLNPIRFHEWYDQVDFQGLRRAEIRNEFCEL